ncbi:MAG: ABC transporter substrate-binding protein [Pseudomonadota bacterium]
MSVLGSRAVTPRRRSILTLRLAAVIAVASVLAPPSAGATPAETAAQAAARGLIDEAHAAQAAAGIGPLTAVIARNFDIAFWERFILGRGGLGMTPAQRAEFRALLPAYIARLYKNQLSGGDAGKPQVISSRVAFNDVFVKARIPRGAGKQPIPAEWRMSDSTGSILVKDIVVGGTTFLVLKRSEFRGVVKREGVAAMLGRMRAIAEGRT